MSDRRKTSRSRLENLLQLVLDQEEELGRVARLLHDDVGQTLSATGLHLDLLRQELGGTAPEAAAQVSEIQNALGRAMASVRELSQALNPTRVERAGLIYVLERLVERLQQGFAGSILLAYDPSVHLPVEAATGFCRIAECALDNAVRHSGATRVRVVVRRRRNAVVLEVRDNGAGFDLARVQRRATGIGLLRMRQCASHAGLLFSIATAPGKGTIVTSSHRSV